MPMQSVKLWIVPVVSPQEHRAYCTVESNDINDAKKKTENWLSSTANRAAIGKWKNHNCLRCGSDSSGRIRVPKFKAAQRVLGNLVDAAGPAPFRLLIIALPFQCE
jgi:hypothetical protein